MKPICSRCGQPIRQGQQFKPDIRLIAPNEYGVLAHANPEDCSPRPDAP